MEQNNLHSIGISVDETFLRKSVRIDILIPYYIVEKNIFQNTFFQTASFHSRYICIASLKIFPLIL